MPPANRKEKGAEAENIASDFLKRRGYRILKRNFSAKTGEIDIIASKEKVLCFVEVKSASYDFLPPEMKVNFAKRKKILKTAEIFIATSKPDFEEIRFDVISVTGGRIKFYEDAFRSD
ncbi:MAG: YraN family protein [Elusimicrobia bacterium]|nr:YraN family protein [Elusimicrobiota bacterium]